MFYDSNLRPAFTKITKKSIKKTDKSCLFIGWLVDSSEMGHNQHLNCKCIEQLVTATWLAFQQLLSFYKPGWFFHNRGTWRALRPEAAVHWQQHSHPTCDRGHTQLYRRYWETRIHTETQKQDGRNRGMHSEELVSKMCRRRRRSKSKRGGGGGGTGGKVTAEQRQQHKVRASALTWTWKCAVFLLLLLMRITSGEKLAERQHQSACNEGGREQEEPSQHCHLLVRSGTSSGCTGSGWNGSEVTTITKNRKRFTLKRVLCYFKPLLGSTQSQIPP